MRHFLYLFFSFLFFLISTNLIFQADLLGDRIVVVSRGKVRCVGTSLFLKSRFGVGYLLTMVKTPECRPEVLDSLIKGYRFLFSSLFYYSVDGIKTCGRCFFVE
jgi:hypothetical protein